MIKKLLVISFMLLFAMQFVLATEIKIKTPEFTEIHLTILDPDADYSSYAIYKKTSDAYGDATFTYAGDALVFDLMVVLKKSDKTIYSNKFRENYVAGEAVYLEIIPDGYELKKTPSISRNIVEGANITNSTEENITDSIEPEITSNITEETPKNKSKILSFAFLKSDGEKPAKENKFNAFYIIGAVIVLLAIVFFVSKSYYNPAPRKIKVTKLSETQPKTLDKKNIDNLIGDASDRIKKAQREIDTLKRYRE